MYPFVVGRRVARNAQHGIDLTWGRCRGRKRRPTGDTAFRWQDDGQGLALDRTAVLAGPRIGGAVRRGRDAFRASVAAMVTRSSHRRVASSPADVPSDPAALPPPAAVIEGIDFAAPSHEVARRLVGVTLLVDGIGGRIVETEAYDRDDPASHSFSGPTPRNAAMFGPPGRVYVYRSYGIHWCLNFVCRAAGHGAGVLIRAIEPTVGLDRMRERRGLQDVRLLCAGPGRVGQALGVDRRLDGLPLDAPPFVLIAAPDDHPAVLVDVGPRIGISKAVDVPWRFGERGSRFLSRAFGRRP